MGTCNFTVGQINGKANSVGAAGVFDTADANSGAYTSTGSATFVEDSADDIVLKPGQFVRFDTDTASWIRFGGRVAAAGTGFHLLPSTPYEWEVGPNDGGKVSIIEG